MSRFREEVWQAELPPGVEVIWRGEESAKFLPVRILSNGACQFYDYQFMGVAEWQEDHHPAMLELSRRLIAERKF